jgi:UTP-glucose-1-phosphate uridylyltransferase
MKAVIMAGGAGSRLRPLTSNQPKPMVPVANRPLMEHIVRLLKRHGFTDIVVTVQFLASLVRNYFGTGEDLGVAMSYATEEFPLGTAGSVKNAASALDETFLVISGDALTDIDLGKAVAFHHEKGAMATIVLSRQPNPLEYGIVVTDDSGRIERFLEKPGWGQVFTDAVNTGIYVLDPGIFDHIPDGEPSDFSQDIFPKLLEAGEPSDREPEQAKTEGAVALEQVLDGRGREDQALGRLGCGDGGGAGGAVDDCDLAEEIARPDDGEHALFARLGWHDHLEVATADDVQRVARVAPVEDDLATPVCATAQHRLEQLSLVRRQAIEHPAPRRTRASLTHPHRGASMPRLVAR